MHGEEMVAVSNHVVDELSLRIPPSLSAFVAGMDSRTFSSM